MADDTANWVKIALKVGLPLIAVVVSLLVRKASAARRGSPHGTPIHEPPPLDEWERELVRARRKIDAIKSYRNRTMLGLLEAKTAVDAAERGIREEGP